MYQQVCDIWVCEVLKVAWKSSLFRLLQGYSAGFFTSSQINSLSHRSAMPRSFLVKSKRTHPLGSFKDSFRQQPQPQTEAGQPFQHAMGQDRRYPEDAVQPLSPVLGVKDLLAEACSPWDGMAVRSHSAPTDDPWPSGTQHFLQQWKCFVWLWNFYWTTLFGWHVTVLLIQFTQY